MAKFEEEYTRNTFYVRNDLWQYFCKVAGDKKGEKTRIINEALQAFFMRDVQEEDKRLNSIQHILIAVREMNEKHDELERMGISIAPLAYEGSVQGELEQAIQALVPHAYEIIGGDYEKLNAHDLLQIDYDMQEMTDYQVAQKWVGIYPILRRSLYSNK